jgi:solute carrier family 26 (sodium-independent sulfate anion transporter), member 11
MVDSRVKVGRLLAKALGVKLDDPNTAYDSTTRGESVFSTKTADTFVEEEPTSWEWLQETVPSWKDIWAYFRSLFPFTYWITRYNVQWLIGDLVAGRLPHPSLLAALPILTLMKALQSELLSSPKGWRMLS